MDSLAERIGPVGFTWVEAVVIGCHILVHGVGKISKASFEVVLVGNDEVKGTLFLVSAVTSGGRVETDGNTKVAGDHDVIIIDWVVVGRELASQTFPLPVGHDTLGQRLFDAVAASLGGIAVEARSVMCQIKRQRVDDAVELVAHSTGLELIDDIVVAQVGMWSKTALNHVLDKTEGFQVKFTRARGGCGDCMLSLFLDFLGQPLVASVLRNFTLGVDLSRLPYRPRDHGDAGCAPEETSRVNQAVASESSCEKGRTKPQKKRKENSAHGKPHEKSDRDTDESDEESQGSWDVTDSDETSAREEKAKRTSACCR